MSRALVALALLAAAHVHPARAQAPSGQITARVSAYCDHGVTRSGQWTRHGVVAVDPRVIPLYSNVAIEGDYTEYLALDTGGAVKGAWVDLWMASCADAREWGVREREVWWSAP